ncbi:hypothetical protein J7T55_000110, partial [Diaporthe amygdali]|uniref:uncharacterized protein n=1 Tax=Phomopsis amygdali TaxID=1214568 RepID=UPI0022FE03B7
MHSPRDWLQNLTLDLILVLQVLRTSRVLPSHGGGKNLFSDLSKFNDEVNSDNFDFDLSAISSMPSLPTKRTARSGTRTSFADSSEHRKYVDDVLKEELGAMHVGLRKFDGSYFGGVADLETVSVAFFKQCIKGSTPLFDDGWTGWPKDANQVDVLDWFARFSDSLSTFPEVYKSSPVRQRRPLTRPNEPIVGSIAKRKMDVGVVNDSKAKKNSRWP